MGRSCDRREAGKTIQEIPMEIKSNKETKKCWKDQVKRDMRKINRVEEGLGEMEATSS